MLTDSFIADELEAAIIRIINEKQPQDVKQLSAFIKKELPLSEDKILDAILKLQNQGKIKLEHASLPASPAMATYLKPWQALWYWVTITIAAITVAVVFTVPEDFQPWSYLRNALGIVFVLWLPGYAVVKALFPVRLPIETSTENLDIIERIALSIGMSIAIVPIIGLILYYTPWGINLTPIVLSLFALTLIFATVAMARQHQTKIRQIRHS